MPSPEFQCADWPAPARVRSLVTTRNGGVSMAPYGGGQPGMGGWNLGARVGDKPEYVAENRKILRGQIGYPLLYLHQVHGVAVADLDCIAYDPPPAGDAGAAEPQADACVSTQAGRPCVILVADCLPVLLCDRLGRGVAAAHCGWRGLAGGVLEATAAALQARSGAGTQDLLAWLGPAIGPQHFEVGPEVRAAFVDAQAEDEAAFQPVQGGKYLADLFALARARLRRLGVGHVSGGGSCTYAQPERYYSHRRATHAGEATGRMAAAVWLAG